MTAARPVRKILLPPQRRLRTTIACVLLAASAVACRGERASTEDCNKACARVAYLETTRLRDDQKVLLGEPDEVLEAREEFTKKALEQIERSTAAGIPAPDPKQLAKLSPARRAAVMNSYQERLKIATESREVAIKQTKASIEEVRAGIAKVKAEGKVVMDKALAAATEKCQTRCLAGSKVRAQCLQRTQAPDDVPLCDR